MQGSLRAVHTNFHAKSGVCSSKNGRVIALGTKEDTIICLSVIISIDYIFQTFYPRPSGYICHSVPPSLRPSVKKNSNSNFSALVLDRDLGFSRGHQSNEEDKDGMMRRRSRTTRMTTGRPRRSTRRRTMTITKLSSVLPF